MFREEKIEKVQSPEARRVISSSTRNGRGGKCCAWDGCRERRKRISIWSLAIDRGVFAGQNIVFSRDANRKSITTDVVRANNFALKLDSPVNEVEENERAKELEEKVRVFTRAAFNFAIRRGNCDIDIERTRETYAILTIAHDVMFNSFNCIIWNRARARYALSTCLVYISISISARYE